MRGVSFALGEVALFFMVVAVLGTAIGWVLRDWLFANKAELLDGMLRDERAEYRRLEAALGAKERELERALEERAKAVEAAGLGDLSRTIVLSKRPLRPGRLIQPSALEAVRALRSDEGEPPGPWHSPSASVRSVAPFTAPPPPPPPPAPEAVSPGNLDFEDNGRARKAVPDIAGVSTPVRLPTERDDLTRIRGVGPTLERRINEFGIQTFRRLAALDEVELDELADATRLSRSRLRRDDWVGCARTLESEAHGAD